MRVTFCIMSCGYGNRLVKFFRGLPGAWFYQHYPRVVSKSSVCSDGAAGPGQVITFLFHNALTPSDSPWPQDCRVTTNIAVVHAHNLKGQQLLKAKTWVWIDVNMTSEKVKEQCSAGEHCVSISWRKRLKVGRKKKGEVCVFAGEAQI